MAEPLTNFQVRQKDVRRLDKLLPPNGMKKADRLAVLIRGFEMLGPGQRFAAITGTQPINNNDARGSGMTHAVA